MTRYFTAAETAKLVRADLKVAFPGVKFSVKSRTYSMGSHVTVSWTDGPATKAVERVTNRYGGRGMMDNTDYMPTQYRMYNGEEVHFSDTSCSRHYSAELMNRIAQRLWNRMAYRNAPDARPVYGDHGWEGDFHTGNYWFSSDVWQAAARTHVVSRAEMAGHVAPTLAAHPVTHEA